MTDDQKPLSLAQEESEALDRIARTGDGKLLHRYLRRVLEAVIDAPPRGALPSQNGRRSLARDLMREMAQGIEDTARDGRTSAEQPILTRRQQPVALAGRRASVRDRLAAGDTELASLTVNTDADAKPE